MIYKSDFKKNELRHELYWEEREMEMEARKRLSKRNRKIEEERELLKKERAKEAEKSDS